jgi:hypothetical protein
MTVKLFVYLHEKGQTSRKNFRQKLGFQFNRFASALKKKAQSTLNFRKNYRYRHFK